MPPHMTLKPTNVGFWGKAEYLSVISTLTDFS